MGRNMPLNSHEVPDQKRRAQAVASVEHPVRTAGAMGQAHFYKQLSALARQAVDLTDPQELLQRAPALVAQALDCDSALVYLLEPNHLELRIVSTFGQTAGLNPGEFVANRVDVPAGFVLAGRRPVVVPDWSRENRFTAPSVVLQLGLKSGLGVPLFDRGEAVGVLSVGSTQTNHFGAGEQEFLEAVASVLATSLQRAQVEAQLRQAHKMECVGNLTGGIAHDFNNLLTVILGNLQMAQERLKARGDGHGLELLQAAIGASRRAADLTGKLLAFSRRQILVPSRIPLGHLLPSLADLLRRTLGEKISILVEVAPGCPPCLADPVQLESALLNIAINARDAMPEGGTLSFSCSVSQGPAVDLPNVAPDGPVATSSWVRIRVTDTGFGMSEAVRERAFEPFFTTKEAGRGTGLGLSSVYGFVRQSSGNIALESVPGTGTTVTMLLPAADDDDAALAAPPPGNTPILAGLRVLLVEDDAEVRDLVQQFFESFKCHVSAHASAESAWADLCENGAFGLLITDIELGAGMKGTEFARRARLRFPDLPVLLNSGYTNYLSDERREAPGRWPLLRKPFSKEALAEAVALALGADI